MISSGTPIGAPPGAHEMMCRLIVLECTTARQGVPEVIMLRGTRRWVSPADAWLPASSGRWSQVTLSGLSLRDDTGRAIAFMKGLVFSTACESETGDFRFDAGDDVGRWKVVRASA